MIEANRIVVTKKTLHNQAYELYIHYDKQNHPIDFLVHSMSNPSLIGNIYIAKIEKIRPEFHGVFLKTNTEHFFAPITQLKSAIVTHHFGPVDKLCEGDEVVVQVIRDKIKTKDAEVTGNLSFHSNHLVLTSSNHKKSISKKITSHHKAEIKNWLSQKEDDFGIVVRSNAIACSIAELEAEYHQLKTNYELFLKQIIHKQWGNIILEGKHPFEEIITRQLSTATTNYEFLTDSNKWYQWANTNDLITSKSDLISCRLYQDKDYSLDKLLQLDTLLENCLKKKLYLPHGGDIVIETTEACTVIDVNSGKDIKKKRTEDYFYKINMEAAKSIANQLRLRNISGVILIDFINLSSKELQDNLLQYLRKETLSDNNYVEVLGYTRLGWIEVTRQKKFSPLHEILSL